MDSYTEAESEMSLESRSFLHRVNDQMRKRQNQSSKDATKDSDKHSVIWGMFMSSTLQASVFMVKIIQTICIPSKKTEDLTLKQMFDISEKLISEQSDEIYGVKTINWEKSSWKYFSLIGDEQVISLQRTKVYVFSDSVLCLGKMNENPQSNIAWEDRLTWFKSSPEFRALDKIDGEPMEFEWNIFRGFTTLQLVREVQELLSRLSVEPENFTGRIIFMSMFNDISWRSKDNEKECESSAQLVSLFAKRFGAGQWSFLGPGSEKTWFSTHEYNPQGEWDRIAEQMMLTFAESPHPIFRSTSPLSRGVLKSKGGRKLSIHFCADGETVETVFRTIISVIQLSIYGAVSDLCVECNTYHVRTGRPVVARQSNPLFVPNVMKTHIPLIDDPAQPEEDLLQRYQEQIEKLSQQDRVIQFCTNAGFLTTVEVGQYFTTKDTEEFSQFTDSVACREYTLPRDEDSSEPKGWIRGNTKIGPVLDVTTCCLEGKDGVEIRIESTYKDHSHSWVRISHGLNKLVTNLNNKEHDDNEQETSEMQFEDYASKTDARAFASRSKAKAKPQRRISASSSTKTIPIVKEFGPKLNHKIIRPSIIQCRRN